MSAVWPAAVDGGQQESAGVSTANSAGITLTANITPNTENTGFTELIASTGFDADGFYLNIIKAGTSADYLLDIAIGAASSEVEIVTDLLFSGSTAVTGWRVPIPVPILAGSRVSARVRSSDASATCVVSVHLENGGFFKKGSLGRSTTYGQATADSGGTGIDPGGTANTKPSGWTQITASTTDDIKYMIVCIGTRNNAAMADAAALVDIGVGASSSEVALLENIPVASGTAYDVWGPGLHFFEVNVPSGTRLSARCQCSIIDATDRLMDVAIVGFC